MNTVDEILKYDLCLGCGLCEALNKQECKMVITSKGFYQPSFKDKRNIDEKLIHAVCPGITIKSNDKKSHKSIWGDVVSVANAWAANHDIRQKSSSGGITSALAIYLLESKKVDGILHVGVDEGTYLYNRLFISRTKEDVLKRNASRYAPAAVFTHIIDLFEQHPDETYAFIGKPCDIAAMRNLLAVLPKYKHKIAYFLAIFCAGMPSYNATKDAIKTFGKNKTVTSLRYRGDGWPGYFTVTYADGEKCKMTYNDSWGKILGRRLGFRCKICPDGIGMLADIASGDSWNTKNGYPDFTEGDGRNFCFIRTLKGQYLMEEAKSAGYIDTDELNIDDVKDMQRYQFDRRHYVGWRIAAVQLATSFLLNFHGLGYVHTALKANFYRALKDSYGTLKRLCKIVKQ